MEQKKDLLTQELFFKRRSNQKFASAQNRIRFNNIKAREKRLAKAPFEKVLDNNRTIMGKILGTKPEKTVSRDFLLGAGFSFDFFTYQREHSGINYSGIYEFGIAKLSDGNYKIIKFNNGQVIGNR